jgi:HEPN domain-containing protein
VPMKRLFTREQGYTERDLFLFAEGHRRACALLFSRGPVYLDSAACLGHLAIELLLKMHLLDRAGGFPNSHDLLALASALCDVFPGLEFTEDGLAMLRRRNGFAGARYPDPRQPVRVSTKDCDLIMAFCQGLRDARSSALLEKLKTGPDGIDPAWLTKGGRVLMQKPIKSGNDET